MQVFWLRWLLPGFRFSSRWCLAEEFLLQSISLSPYHRCSPELFDLERKLWAGLKQSWRHYACKSIIGIIINLVSPSTRGIHYSVVGANGVLAWLRNNSLDWRLVHLSKRYIKWGVDFRLCNLFAQWAVEKLNCTKLSLMRFVRFVRLIQFSFSPIRSSPIDALLLPIEFSATHVHDPSSSFSASAIVSSPVLSSMSIRSDRLTNWPPLIQMDTGSGWPKVLQRIRTSAPTINVIESDSITAFGSPDKSHQQIQSFAYFWPSCMTSSNDNRTLVK